MSFTNMNKQEISEIVDEEGLCVAIRSYIPSCDIEDKELALMWHQATDLLRSIQNTLE